MKLLRLYQKYKQHQSKQISQLNFIQNMDSVSIQIPSKILDRFTCIIILLSTILSIIYFIHKYNPNVFIIYIFHQTSLRRMTEQKAKLDLKDIENGPLEERECRDVICCILFIANVVAMIYCSAWGYSYGNPSNIFRGTDTNLNICNSTLGKPYLYFYNPTSLSTSNRVCVQTCPAMVGGTLQNIVCSDSDCTYSDVITSGGYQNHTTRGDGKTYIGYQTYTFLDRICFPTAATLDLLNKFSDTTQPTTTSNGTSASTYFYNSIGGNYLSGLISDITNNWAVLLGGFALAIVIAFIFMFLLRCLAGCIVWLSMIGTVVFIAGLGFIFFYSSGQMTVPSQLKYMGQYIPVVSGNSTYLSYYAYALWAVSGLLLIILICCCSRIRLAVAVCKCAGKFIVQVCSTMLVPIIMSLITVVAWVVCAVGMIYLVSSAQYINDGSSIFSSIASYTDMALARFYYFVFGTLWCNALIQAFTTFVIASACCMWYYSHGPGQDLHLPVLRSYGRGFRYHFGSLAFGSLILAIVQFMQLIVQAFKKNAEASGADQTKVMEYVVNCLRCCLACIQRIVQFLNKSAYIQIALRGKNFCMAAKDGFELVWSNPLRYSVVGGIGQVLMFLGKIMIAAGTTGSVYAFIQFSGVVVFLQPLLILLLVFVYSYAIGVVFMVVYSLAMDTLLVCFIVDQISQKQKGGKGAQYAPQELAELMDSQ